MRRMLKFFLFSVILIILNSVCIYSDIPTAQFILVGQGARAQAMGQSAVSNCFDYSALYWNPAASVFLKNPEIGINYNQLPADINSNYLAFIRPRRNTALGFSAILEQTKVPGFDANGDSLGNINNVDSNFNIVCAYKFFNSVGVGLGFGPMDMQLGTEKKYATNVNIGTIFKKGRVSAGVTAANFGTKLKSDAGQELQPMLLRAGGSYSFLKRKNLLVAASYETIFDDENAGGIGAGVEYFVIKNFAVRCGSKVQNDGNIKPSFGFGLNYKRIVLDYAYTMASSELKGTEQNHLGLSFKLEDAKAEEEDAETERAAAHAKALERKTADKEQERERIDGIINVAVADFAGKNVSAADASIVADFLRTDLVSIGAYKVIDKNNMDKILAEAAFQQTGCIAAECAVQLGKILNVRQMIVGSLSKLIDTYYITVSLVDVETGEIKASFKESAVSSQELEEVSYILARKLSR